MALIDRLGQMMVENWFYLRADAAPNAYAVVAANALSGDSGWHPLGVLVHTERELELILPYLDRLALVVVSFPKFRDGRGFTIARTLRERYRFAGDVRALGNILPDQFAALVQCGFSSIVTPLEHPPEQWAGARPGRSAVPGQLLHRMLGRGAQRAEAGPAEGNL